MLRHLLVSTTVAMLLASGQSGQVFRSGVVTVYADAAVTRGRVPVQGLTASDFRLTDNGVDQRVEVVTDRAVPIDVSLVVDATWFAQGLAGNALGPAGTDALQRGAAEMTTLLHDDDRLRVLTYAASVVETRPMSPIGANAAISLANPTTWELWSRSRVGQAILTALSFTGGSDRRHLVFVFSQARGVLDLFSAEPMVQAARRSDATVYSIVAPLLREHNSVQSVPAYPSDQVIRDALSAVAEASGGSTYLTGDAIGAFRDVLQRIRSSYVLRYTLDGVRRSGWHEIAVSVPKCPTCKILARRGYMGQ